MCKQTHVGTHTHTYKYTGGAGKCSCKIPLIRCIPRFKYLFIIQRNVFKSYWDWVVPPLTPIGDWLHCRALTKCTSNTKHNWKCMAAYAGCNQPPAAAQTHRAEYAWTYVCRCSCRVPDCMRRLNEVASWLIKMSKNACWLFAECL